MQLLLELLTNTIELKEASDEVLAKEQGPSIREICFLSFRFKLEKDEPARKPPDTLLMLLQAIRMNRDLYLNRLWMGSR